MSVIKVENLQKKFKIPLDKKNTLKQHFLRPFDVFRYQEFIALDNLSFQIEAGQWIGVIGNNGSGKSTLLKLLSGIYLPDRGRLQVTGKVVSFLELGVGFNPEFTAIENIYLNGAFLGLSRRLIKDKIDNIMDFAEIGRFKNLKLKNFSSGMQLRLAFAIAMQAEADIYLFDEVLAVGDIHFQKKCQTEFNKLKNNNKTVVIVSHDLDRIARYVDKVMLLEQGRLTKFSPPEIVLPEYRAKE